MTILTLVLTSCTTLPKNNVKAEIPDPIVDGESVVKYDLTTDSVTMPLWYWKKVVRYMVITSEMEEGE